MAFVAVAQGVADIVQPLLVEVVADQEATGEADDLVGAVAGNLLEGRIDVNNRVVELGR